MDGHNDDVAEVVQALSSSSTCSKGTRESTDTDVTSTETVHKKNKSVHHLIEYKNARERQYHNAVMCWNDIDGSGRDRIDMAKVLKQLNA